MWGLSFIVVNHITDENPYLFVFNRLLDTMIGIGIGVCVNCFQLPRPKRKEILFLSGYEFTYVISPENSMLIKEYFAQRKIPYFANVIIDDLLLIYYHDTDYVEYNQLVNMLRTSPYRNYIHRTVPDDECVVYYMVIDTFDNINNLHEELKELPFANGL